MRYLYHRNDREFSLQKKLRTPPLSENEIVHEIINTSKETVHCHSINR